MKTGGLRSAALAGAITLGLALAAPALAISLIANGAFGSAPRGATGARALVSQQFVVRAPLVTTQTNGEAGEGAGVGFSLWAQSRLGPLQVKVVNRSDDGSDDALPIFDLDESAEAVFGSD